VDANLENGCMDIVRGQRLARVKFVSLPMDAMPGNVLREAPIPGIWAERISVFVSRVIGRLVAARP
jgi:hypothetical protein